MKRILVLLLCVTVMPVICADQQATPDKQTERFNLIEQEIAQLKKELQDRKNEDLQSKLKEFSELLPQVKSLVGNKKSELDIKVNKDQEKIDKRAALLEEFAGLAWGMGISWTLDNKNNRVNKAEIIDSLVRITEEDNVKIRMLAELHYFFSLPDTWQEKWLSKYKTTCHWGPFVAIDTQDFKKLDGAGGGWMFGFRSEDKSHTFNIGIGWMVDSNTKELGGDLKDGQPLPAGAKEIWYKTRSQGGVVIITSFTF